MVILSSQTLASKNMNEELLFQAVIGAVDIKNSLVTGRVFAKIRDDIGKKTHGAPIVLWNTLAVS
jgi:hypothetical protein